MKRQIFALAVCTIAVLTISNVHADVILFEEDFESGLTGWTIQDDNADEYTWSAVNDDWYRQIGSGTYADLDADRIYWEIGDEMNWEDSLISPTINVTGMENVNVSTDIFYQPYYEDGLMTVNYSVNDGQTWLQLAEWDESENGNITWDIDLAAGTTGLLVSFDYYSPGLEYQILQVDNVLVTGTPVPEPATVSLLGLGLVSLIRSRRKV